jgi:hypothetical protein
LTPTPSFIYYNYENQDLRSMGTRLQVHATSRSGSHCCLTHTSSERVINMWEDIKRFFNWIMKWTCIFSTIIGTAIIWSDIFFVYFRHGQYLLNRPDIQYISTMTPMHQFYLALAAPFISAFIGGVIMGIAIYFIVLRILSLITRTLGLQ